jgi:hypothetical protein
MQITSYSSHSASFGPSAVRVDIETVYSGRREAGLVVASIANLPQCPVSDSPSNYLSRLVRSGVKPLCNDHDDSERAVGVLLKHTDVGRDNSFPQMM